MRLGSLENGNAPKQIAWARSARDSLFLGERADIALRALYPTPPKDARKHQGRELALAALLVRKSDSIIYQPEETCRRQEPVNSRGP